MEAEQIRDICKRDFQERNLMCKKRFDWVEKCFEHFWETFPEISENTKKELIKLVKSIDDNYQKHEQEIEKMEEITKDASDTAEVQRVFHSEDEQVQFKWQRFEPLIGSNLEKILTDIESSDKSTNWFSVLNRILDSYKQKYTGRRWLYWIKGDYISKPITYLPCIICNKNPNCIEKPKKMQSIICSTDWTAQEQCSKKGCKECLEKVRQRNNPESKKK